MWFRRRAPRSEPRSQAWQSLAERLEMRPLHAEAGRLQTWLGEHEGRVERLWALQRDGQPDLYLFEHERRRAVRGTVRWPRVLLRHHGDPWPVSWRAFPRRHQVLSSLRASRAGGSLVASGDAAFDEVVGVVAREEDAAADLLVPPLRAALLRLLDDSLPDAELLAGQRHLLWSARDEVEPPFEALEVVAARVLGVYAALPLP